ncbi:MAG: fructose bisphosphate aldolase [Micropruina sp.]|nr:MAG: fructose bisphosphate aldolase [Micropruina sp.]
MNTEQYERMAHDPGFVAALDQSGGSTPKALGRYGIAEDAWTTEAEMFDLIHAMRTRVMTSPAFTGDKILAAILFEQTMEREVEGQPTGDYLWQTKHVVSIVKVDQGLDAEAHGVQLMKELTKLDGLLERAVAKGMFGTKMRSVIKHADAEGIASVVAQQFFYGRRILDAGLVPILEPEIDVKAPDKAECETLLKEQLLEFLAGLDDRAVMLKLTIPDVDDFYADLIAHPNVLRVVALSGGYSRAEANERLARHHGLIASFSRALLEGLSAQQSDEEFNATLAESIDEVYQASTT